MTPNPITPIIDPLIALLRSRAVLVALLALIARFIAEYTPLSPEIQEGITNLGLAIIAKMAFEDVAQKFASRPVTPTNPTVVNVDATSTPTTVDPPAFKEGL